MHVQFCNTKTIDQTEEYAYCDGQQQRNPQRQGLCNAFVHTGCISNALQQGSGNSRTTTQNTTSRQVSTCQNDHTCNTQCQDTSSRSLRQDLPHIIHRKERRFRNYYARDHQTQDYIQGVIQQIFIPLFCFIHTNVTSLLYIHRSKAHDFFLRCILDIKNAGQMTITHNHNTVTDT